MKIKKKLNINFYLFKLLNDQKKKLSVAAIKYIAFQANSFIFFVAFSYVCFLQLRKVSTFFYIEFFTYKHKFSINLLTNDNHDAIQFFFVKCLKILLRDNVITKIEPGDEFQKIKKCWKIDLILKIDEKKNVAFQKSKKKCRDKIKYLSWTLWNEKNFRMIFYWYNCGILFSTEFNLMACDLRLGEHTAQMYVFSNIASFGHVIHKNEHIKVV